MFNNSQVTSRRKTLSVEAVKIAGSAIDASTAAGGTWSYPGYVDNLNEANKLELQEKNLKLEKLKFDYQVLTEKAKNADQLLKEAEKREMKEIKARNQLLVE